MCSFHRIKLLCWCVKGKHQITFSKSVALANLKRWTEFEMPSLLYVDSPRSYRRIQGEKKKYMAKGATISWLSDQLSNGAILLLLDCRPYAEYAQSHVQGAINLTIPSLMLRRLKKGANFAISSMITSEDGKAQFNRNLRLASGIVLYDSETNDVSSVCSNSALGVLLKKFSEDVNTPVWLLEGKIKDLYLI